jgi:hypothetical protein
MRGHRSEQGDQKNRFLHPKTSLNGRILLEIGEKGRPDQEGRT